MVSLCNLTLYTTTQLCMQCLTHLIFLLGAVGSLLNNWQSALLDRDFWQSFMSDYPAFLLLPPCQIRNLWTPHYSTSWSLSIINVSLFMIWTILYTSPTMLGGFQTMLTRSGQLLEVILDMRLHGDSIHTVRLMRPAALALYGLSVIKFFAIQQNIGIAQWGNTCWQKLTSYS